MVGTSRRGRCLVGLKLTPEPKVLGGVVQEWDTSDPDL